MRSPLLRISCTTQLLSFSCFSPSSPAPVDHSTCIRRLPSSNDEFSCCRRALTSSDKSEASFAPLCHDPQANVTERHLPKIDHKRLRYQLTKLIFCSAFDVYQLERIHASFHWRFSHKLKASCLSTRSHRHRFCASLRKIWPGANSGPQSFVGSITFS